MPWLSLWAQGTTVTLPSWIQWMIVWADPQFTDARLLGGFFGGFMTWSKLLGLVCLISWLGTRFFNLFLRSQQSRSGQSVVLNLPVIGLLLFVGIAILTAFLSIVQQAAVFPIPLIAGYPIPALLVGIEFLLGFLALEAVMWSSYRRPQGGSASQRGLALGVHAALAAGVFVIYKAFEFNRNVRGLKGSIASQDWQLILTDGLRYGATYAGLVVLAYFALGMFKEALSVRWRRLYSIAWQTVLDAVRRMWAPWVVLVLFVLFLAFTNWFLGGPGTRTPELARRYIETLSWVSSLLLSLMILLLAPMSLPTDIRTQVIYTITTKPVNRLELIWGRLIGYMGLITAVLLVMGLVSMFFVERVVNSRISTTREQAVASREVGKLDDARRSEEQAAQLENKMSARVPVFGFLSFTDSRGKARRKGIDVGQEQKLRSHIEGASASKASWRFGQAPQKEGRTLTAENVLPIERLLKPGTLEAVEDSLFRARYDQAQIKMNLEAPNLKGSERRRLEDRLTKVDSEVKRIQAELEPIQKQERDLREQIQKLEGAGKSADLTSLRAERDKLHSPPIPVEMVFNVFRTSKGELGEAVRASMVVSNPLRPDLELHRSVFPVIEYYTIRRFFPSRMLVGSMGQLAIEIQCITPSQFIGMSEKDLYVLSNQGSFRTNYIAGLTGVWLQALVITSVGLFAGTFLSWSVAFLLTLAVFVFGQLAIGFLDQFNQMGVVGGGPFESLIRLLTHENLQSNLASTPAVMAAKSFDLFLTPILTRLIYVIPNISALDVSNQVALGFAVTTPTLIGQVLLGLGYALPLTAFAYYIFKNREIAA